MHMHMQYAKEPKMQNTLTDKNKSFKFHKRLEIDFYYKLMKWSFVGLALGHL